MFRSLFVLAYAAYIAALFFAPMKPPGFFWGVTTLLMPAIEIATAICTGWLFWIALRRYNPWLAAISGVAPVAVLTLIYVSQFLSLYISGSYLTPLALENVGETQFIASPNVFALIGGALALFIALVIWLKNAPPTSTSRRTKVQAAAIIPLWILAILQVDSRSSPGDPVILQPDLSPASALVRTERTVRFKQTFSNLPTQSLSEGYAGIASFDLGKPQPFQRVSSFISPLPFEGTVPKEVKPNIIVFFTEGFSARLMESYGGRINDLTPNLDAYSNRFMLVDDYYNHTAASYRGIIGQLSSGFMIDGGEEWQDRLGSASTTSRLITSGVGRTIPEILLSSGYQTFFMTGHGGHDYWAETLRKIGHTNIFNLDNISSLLGYQPLSEAPVPGVPDRDLYRALEAFCKQRAHSEPYFIGVYNSGTHAFIDTPKGKEKFANGENPMLNRMHEYDTSIGSFLDYFFSSPVAENTILIVTSDHATYPEPPTVDVFDGPNYRPYFVDRIPLMIYSPYHELPKRFDANVRTSVDFAPTLLHLLGSVDVEHAFLGRSIFEDASGPGIQLASIGNEFFALGGPKFVTPIEDTILTDEQEKMKNTISLYYHMQQRGDIFVE